MLGDMDTYDTVYAAGFFDGEGSINITKGTNGKGTEYFVLEASVSQVDPRPLEFLQEIWGGNLRAVNANNERCRPFHRWGIRSQMAENFIRDIRPYLKVKDIEADIALNFRTVKSKYIKKATGRGSEVDQEAFNQRAIFKRSLELSRQKSHT